MDGADEEAVAEQTGAVVAAARLHALVHDDNTGDGDASDGDAFAGRLKH